MSTPHTKVILTKTSQNGTQTSYFVGGGVWLYTDGTVCASLTWTVRNPPLSYRVVLEQKAMQVLWSAAQSLVDVFDLLD